MQEAHKRMNGHRSKFTEAGHQGSALAQHCWEAHRDQFSLDYFKLGLIKNYRFEHMLRVEAQVTLLNQIVCSNELLESDILSSVKPSIGRRFLFPDLEERKFRILQAARQQILTECSIPEATRALNELNLECQAGKTPGYNSDHPKMLKIRRNIERKHQVKKQFFVNKPQQAPCPNKRRGAYRARRKRRVKERKGNAKEKRLEARRQKVETIKTTTVRNLSDEEVPDGAYLYLAKGLNFVETKPLEQEDLKHDAREFLRKLEWRAHFHQIGKEDTREEDDHPELRIPSRRWPTDFQSNVVDEIKRNLLAYVDSLRPPRPKSNLNYLELEGKKWLIQAIEEEKIFISKADKGGATLILNYRTALGSVEESLADRSKFSETDTPISDRMLPNQPPIRLVHATRNGPLYRLEKWVSPYLTKLSKEYVGEEFLRDTDELLKQLNGMGELQGNTRVFTLDVQALYPSIRKDLALTALDHALSNLRSRDDKAGARSRVPRETASGLYLLLWIGSGRDLFPSDHSVEAQVTLLNQIVCSNELLESDILSSVKPSIGRRFLFPDLEERKFRILQAARQQILTECSIPEATRALNELNLECQAGKTPGYNSDHPKMLKIRRNIERKHQVKKQFFVNKPQQAPCPNKRRGAYRARRKRRVKERKGNAKEKRLEARRQKVETIKTTTVRNLSDEEVPDGAYLYLAKGLNFVETKPLEQEDLKHDAREFLRKLEWRAHFHQIGKEDTREEDDHPELRIPSRRWPTDFQSNVVDEIKRNLLAYVDSLRPPRPKSNLNYLELEGKKWLIQAIEEEKIFISKADKGGATLILNYRTALGSVEESLADRSKFSETDTPISDRMSAVTAMVKILVLEEVERGNISERDKTLITGINRKGNLKTSPVLRPEVPFTYPLFKIHKLTEEQISEGLVPPIRLVHATRNGPLYRLEKWVSPYLTKLSKEYVGEEFLRDTDELLKQLNGMGELQGNTRVFTLDVQALYPSIRKDLALTALDHALSNLRSRDDKAGAVKRFVKCILEETFVTFREVVYTTVEGIPTGNCISRQLADIFLHWLLFVECPRLIPREALMWRRFIDDVFGIWRGSERQLANFISSLNRTTSSYGIIFGDHQFGETVNFLDTSVTIENSRIHYRLYRKPTDARDYLKTDSYHPKHVFKSVIFSQMIRVINRNSRESTRLEDLNELKIDLLRSGQLERDLDHFQSKAVDRAQMLSLGEPGSSKPDTPKSLVFATTFFEGIDELRSYLKGLEEDIAAITGGCTVLLSMRKSPAIGNLVVRNRRLSESSTGPIESEEDFNQKCGGPGCRTCPMMSTSPTLSINGQRLKLNGSLNCKSKNIIYIAQCTICSRGSGNRKEDSYIGQTMQEAHKRMNGHRSKFTEAGHQGSALAQHGGEAHRDQFSLDYFKLGLIKTVSPLALDRHENKLIDRLRTKLFGLNRINVIIISPGRNIDTNTSYNKLVGLLIGSFIASYCKSTVTEF
eukprot:sb/3460886/